MILDVLLLILLILSILSWDNNLTIHIIAGIAFALLTVIHVFINRKWLVSVSKAFKAGKLNNKVKWNYILDLLLLAAWSIAILSGLLAIGFTLGEKETLLVFTQIHGVSIRLGCVFIVAHVLKHRKQIASYVKKQIT